MDLHSAGDACGHNAGHNIRELPRRERLSFCGLRSDAYASKEAWLADAPPIFFLPSAILTTSRLAISFKFQTAVTFLEQHLTGCGCFHPGFKIQDFGACLTMVLFLLFSVPGIAAQKLAVEVGLHDVTPNLIALDEFKAEAALTSLYERRLLGWASPRSNYSYACVNETWWQETLKRDTSIPGEFEREREFASYLSAMDEDDFTPAAHPPPRQPPRVGLVRTFLLKLVPTDHPPPHPHPHPLITVSLA